MESERDVNMRMEGGRVSVYTVYTVYDEQMRGDCKTRLVYWRSNCKSMAIISSWWRMDECLCTTDNAK